MPKTHLCLSAIRQALLTHRMEIIWCSIYAVNLRSSLLKNEVTRVMLNSNVPPQHNWVQIFQLWDPPSPQLPEIMKKGQLRSALTAEI